MDPKDRQEHLRSLILSRAWTEVVIPEYEARLSKEITALISDGDDRHLGLINILLWALFPHLKEKTQAQRRGRIAALRGLLAWPRSEVETTDVENERERERDAALLRATHFVDRGWRSPVAPPEER
jgi:hypothetical protein